MFNFHLFITVFAILSIFLTPSVGLAIPKQTSGTRKVESLQLKSKVDQIVLDLQELSESVQAGTIFFDYATRVTRLNLAYIKIKDDLEFRQLGGTFWLARAVKSYIDALDYWKKILTPSSTLSDPFIQKNEEILQVFNMKSRQEAWETSASDFAMFVAVRGLAAEISSLSGHCKENPQSRVCE